MVRAQGIKENRVLLLHTAWIVLLAVLSGRLFGLMIFPSVHGQRPSFSSATIRWRLDAEHFQLSVADDARGRILFRDGTRWSGATTFGGNGQLVARKAEVAPEIVGAVGLPDVWPNPARVVPEQGRFGLEWTLDTVLAGRRPGLTGQMAAPSPDMSISTPITDYRLKPLPGKDVVTTIDLPLQQRAETLLQHEHIPHASLVSISLPAREVTVLASVNHKQSDAVRAVAPGSVFKLVTLAAALETYRFPTQAQFHCDGRVHIPHVNMRCWTAHGSLSLFDALVQSCDSTFAQVGVSLGRQPMAVQAVKFGFSQTGIAPFQGKSLIPNADTGMVYRHAGDDPGLLANTAIGQEDVRMSSVQGANLAATIALAGVYRPAALIRGWQTPNGAFRENLSLPSTWRACSAYTADTLQRGMWAAVHNPMGTAYQLHAFPIAAKTGTAELPDGRVNAWLVGFRVIKGRPTEAFAICVMDEPSQRAHQALFRLAKSWFQDPLTAPQ